jgi:recombination protein RecT
MSDERPQTLREWMHSYRDRFQEAIPQGTINLERFIAAATLEIMNNPTLQKCEKASLQACLMQSARYGLEVGSLLGQAYLIPYNESKRLEGGAWAKVMTCHFQLGYKGLIVLARRSKTIRTITAEPVHENDIFEATLGLDPTLVHKIDIRKERGEPIAYYCAVQLENEGRQFKIITKKEAEDHRDSYSKASQQDDKQTSPWSTNFEAMALKTVIIKALKLCPMSVEAMEAVSREEQRPFRNVNDDVLLLPAEPTAEAAPAETVPEMKPEPATGKRVDAARNAAKRAAGGETGKETRLSKTTQGGQDLEHAGADSDLASDPKLDIF